MRRLLLPLALLAFWAPAAPAEPVFAGPVSDARLAVAADGTPTVAYASGGVLSVARRSGGTWPAQTVALPGTDVELDGLSLSIQGQPLVLARDRAGTWLAIVTQASQGLRVRVLRPDAAGDLIGPAGLAADLQGRPVVAYALWLPSEATYLRLVREDARGRLVTQRITRGGFPSSHTLAAAAPVVLPSGRVRVVETFLPAAIDWRPIPGDWLGQILHGTALGVPTGRVGAAANGGVVFAAWTEAYPTLGPPAVVLAVHAAHTHSGLALENAVFADLVVTKGGAELAANRCVADGVCGALVDGCGLDGVVAGYAAEPGGAGRQVLLDGDGGLAWYRSPAPPAVHVSPGRVDGAAGGSVSLYRESPGPRTLVATLPVAADGTYGLPPVDAGVYRAVWTDPETSIPYASLFPQPVS